MDVMDLIEKESVLSPLQVSTIFLFFVFFFKWTMFDCWYISR